MLVMVQKFELVSKQNELDIMKCEYLIETANSEFDNVYMEEFDNELLGHNFYDNFKKPGQDDFDLENNRYKTDKIRTKSRILDGINDAMDEIGYLFGTIIDKIVSLFDAIYDRITRLLYDVKTKASIKKLQFILKNKNKFKQHVVDDARPKYVEKICDRFNIEVSKLMDKSKHMGPNTLEAKFNSLYDKTIKQLEKYMGDIPNNKKVPISEASKAVLDQLKSNPRKIRAMKKRTTDFAEKVGKILETDEDAMGKKGVLTNIISKVTSINSKCTNFVSKHPFAVAGTLLAAGTAGVIVGSEYGYSQGEKVGRIAVQSEGYRKGFAAGSDIGRRN